MDVRNGPNLYAGDIPITAVYADVETDLALCETRYPICSSGLNLAVSWQMPEVLAYGFAEKSPHEMSCQGPLVPESMQFVKDKPIHLVAHFGLPEGFSGGPWIANCKQVPHVIGVSTFGGVRTATSRAIAAQQCLAFLQEVKNDFGLSEMSWKTSDPVLELYGSELARWVGHQKQRFARQLRDPSFLWNIRPRSSRLQNELVWLEAITQKAVAALRSGSLPRHICFFIDAGRLLEFIKRGWHPDALSALASFMCLELNQAEVSPMRDLIQRLIVASRVCWLLFGERRALGRNVFHQPDINKLFARLDLERRRKNSIRRDGCAE